MNDIIEEIKALPHFHTFSCSKCQAQIRVHALEIYGDCPECGTQHKCRSFGAIGTEIQDVIDAVLEWAGEGETFDAVMARHKVIMEDKDD